MGEGNKKLSKRDPESSLLFYVEQGYLPEGMTNYLALLGWSLSEDKDRFSLQEMADAFDITRVNASPARFDLKKCTALNADWIRLLDAEEFCARLMSFLRDQRGVTLDTAGEQTVRSAAGLVQERVETLGQAADMVHFLLVDEGSFSVDPEAAAKQLTADSQPVLDAAYAALNGVDSLVDGDDRGRSSSCVDRRSRAQTARGVRSGAGSGQWTSSVATAV